MFTIGRNERGAQVRVRLRIIWPEADSLAEGCQRWLVLIGLRQHQPEIVLRLRKVRTQTNCLAKLSRNLAVACTLAPKQ